MKSLFAKTDKSIIPDLPRFLFPGKIVVVQGLHEARRAVLALRRAPLIGIDTETRPAFRKGVVNKVALLQASTEEVCFLFRLCHIGLPEELASLLDDESVLKVGLSLKDDFHLLSARDSHLQPKGFVDLQPYAHEMGIEDMSLQKLFANVFGQRISKAQQLSNWEADVLDDKQKLYAATDAYACILLYKELRRLRESGEYTII
ncbi:MAG: 3'-5' exonuclease domain-containing protein 2 [Alloprevotella sp.]|nr:3'-5' exonuclease domain-containing protein 2 [Alloprevotella sp.]MBR1652755.1 3'-5' exonuclease domain-containing protein 2 [Alloprevotella sp.]